MEVLKMELTRESYIESELKKWKDYYEIGFDQEFELEALAKLKYQFTITPDDHVKTMSDILDTITRIKNKLDLKPKYKSSLNVEDWYINIDNYVWEIIRLNHTTGEVKRIKLKEDKKYTTQDFAQLILDHVLEKKPYKLFIDKIGLGKGVYDSVKKLTETQIGIILNEDGKLSYLKN
jgi:hypothetical protein